MWNHLFPEATVGGITRFSLHSGRTEFIGYFHQPVIFGFVVRPYIEFVTVMLNIILMAANTRAEYQKFTRWFARFQQSILGCYAVMVAHNSHIFFGLHSVQTHVKLVVFFFINQRILFVISPQNVPINLITEQGLYIFFDIKQCLVISRPCKIACLHVWDGFGVNRACFQVLDLQRV